MRLRVFVALAAAVLLLSSGLGSGASWYEEVRFADSPVVVTSGGLDVTAADPAFRVQSRIEDDPRLTGRPSCTAAEDFSTCATLTKAQVEAFGFMRGDRLTISSRFDVTAEGENLRYTVTPDGSAETVPAAWVAEKTAVSPAGALTGSQAITADRSFDFVGDTDDDPATTGFEALTIPKLTVHAVQENR